MQPATPGGKAVLTLHRLSITAKRAWEMTTIVTARALESPMAQNGALGKEGLQQALAQRRLLAHQLVPPLAARRVAKVVGAAIVDDVLGHFLPWDLARVQVLAVRQLADALLEKAELDTGRGKTLACPSDWN